MHKEGREGRPRLSGSANGECGRGGRSRAQGGIIEFEAPINISNVMLVDPESDEPTRVGYRRDDDGHLVRFAKKSETELD